MDREARRGGIVQALHARARHRGRVASLPVPSTRVGTKTDDSLGMQCDLAPESRRLVMTFGGFYGDVLEFGGRIDDTGRVPVYEFARSLGSLPLKRVFVRDHAQAWYHKGVAGVASDIEAVADRLREIASYADEGGTLGHSPRGFCALLFCAVLRS